MFGDFGDRLHAHGARPLQPQPDGTQNRLRRQARASQRVRGGQSRDVRPRRVPGDGTSGPYKLSRTDLVANSDRLRIEVRDRIRSEVVVETQQLARFIDYSIDYLTGVVTFKQPIQSRDPAFNPVYVVAEYETLTRNDGGTTAGARTRRGSPATSSSSAPRSSKKVRPPATRGSRARICATGRTACSSCAPRWRRRIPRTPRAAKPAPTWPSSSA